MRSSTAPISTGSRKTSGSRLTIWRSWSVTASLRRRAAEDARAARHQRRKARSRHPLLLRDMERSARFAPQGPMRLRLADGTAAANYHGYRRQCFDAGIARSARLSPARTVSCGVERSFLFFRFHVALANPFTSFCTRDSALPYSLRRHDPVFHIRPRSLS